MLRTDGITIRDWLHLITHKINIEKTGSFDSVFLNNKESKFKVNVLKLNKIILWK
jgi:hypothetical protein